MKSTSKNGKRLLLFVVVLLSFNITLQILPYSVDAGQFFENLNQYTTQERICFPIEPEGDSTPDGISPSMFVGCWHTFTATVRYTDFSRTVLWQMHNTPDNLICRNPSHSDTITTYLVLTNPSNLIANTFTDSHIVFPAVMVSRSFYVSPTYRTWLGNAWAQAPDNKILSSIVFSP
ncbi:MAG: hypothetical protein FWE91_13100 [Defluviitaleaceae bacterium]|nr:hypothetical protein [Defluviitaleaceae bacterium]MCL2837178.1 hypothetical protein [Defluviitaleaceae bacterium]